MQLLAWILAFTIAITIHEAAHAWMADRLGDPTARLMGRLSLNPIVHYDTVGTTMLVVTTILTALNLAPFPFGWAKPVRFDPYNLDDPRKDSALISFAGPASNIIIATTLSVILRVVYFTSGPLSILTQLFIPIIILNVALAIFNLIPVHPLDGGKILIGLLPADQAHEAEVFLKRYGFLVLLLLIFPTVGGTSPISYVISPVINFFLNILIPGSFV